MSSLVIAAASVFEVSSSRTNSSENPTPSTIGMGSKFIQIVALQILLYFVAL